MRFIWPSAGLCPRLPDCVRSLHKHEDSITGESWSLHNTSKTTATLTQARTPCTPDRFICRGLTGNSTLGPGLQLETFFAD